MKNSPMKSVVIVGLIAAILGFGNYLISTGGAQRILNSTKQAQTTPEAVSIEISPTPQMSPTTEMEQELPKTLEYSLTATTSGQTAFALLTSTIENVEYTQYDFGTFIESIGGVAGNNENFWAFYLNGEKAQAGADVTVLEAGDQIKFIYEKIEL